MSSNPKSDPKDVVPPEEGKKDEAEEKKEETKEEKKEEAEEKKEAAEEKKEEEHHSAIPLRVPSFKAPKLSEVAKGELTLAYSFAEPAVTTKLGIDGIPKVIDYEPLKLSSFSVMTLHTATIFENPVLLVEQFFITLIFICCATPVYIMFDQKTEFSENRHGGVTMNKWLDTQEEKMRQFAMIMTTLAAFLLSFYTSICVARWWTIRAEGVGGIKKATVELELYTRQFVTQDEKILSAIRRYARASLVLIALWRRNQLKEMKSHLVSHDILTNEEADLLMKWNHCLHETIWGWQGALIAMLSKEGKIPNQNLLCFLLERVSEGRTAVQCIHTHLAVRVPLPYVHLLGVLVKMHNSILAIIMGILFGAAVRDGRTIICVQLFARTLILPFLFNAILLINTELSDPFDGGVAGFPVSVYEKALENDSKGMLNANEHEPEWMKV